MEIIKMKIVNEIKSFFAVVALLAMMFSSTPVIAGSATSVMALLSAITISVVDAVEVNPNQEEKVVDEKESKAQVKLLGECGSYEPYCPVDTRLGFTVCGFAGTGTEFLICTACDPWLGGCKIDHYHIFGSKIVSIETLHKSGGCQDGSGIGTTQFTAHCGCARSCHFKG